MQKRQLRLSHPVIIRQRLAEFLGKKINIVQQDNTVIFGELTAVEHDQFTIKNMRLKKTQHLINDIYELYLDFDA
jgi:hypothetical protein